MTKEELEKEAEEYRLNLISELREKIQKGCNCKELIDIEMAFQKGAESREKQIEIDAEQIRALQKQNGELTDRLTEAKEIIKELLNSCFGYNSKTVNYEVKVKAEQFLKENA